MRVSFVSDVHGNIEGLARVAEKAEQLVVLGDLLDYVDYHEPDRGILGEVFGEDRVRHFAQLRQAGQFVELHAYNRSLWDGLPDARGVLTEVIESRYREVLAAVGPHALLILGNVDVAAAWDEVAGGVLPCRDGEVVEVGGRRFGFVAGGALRAGRRPDHTSEAAWRPFLRTAADYRAAVERIGPMDVLCSHVPPRLPSLRYDVIPGRLEMFGPGLLEAIDTHQPPLAVFGHVHQPLARRQRRGRTECVNVGHFQRFPVAFEYDLDVGLDGRLPAPG